MDKKLIYETGTGQLLYPTHQENGDCHIYGCVIHHPSDHHMKGWPTNWRSDRRIMERMCEHGVGHPDPDDANYNKRMGKDVSVHGCDGCCNPSNKYSTLD